MIDVNMSKLLKKTIEKAETMTIGKVDNVYFVLALLAVITENIGMDEEIWEVVGSLKKKGIDPWKGKTRLINFLDKANESEYKEAVGNIEFEYLIGSCSSAETGLEVSAYEVMEMIFSVLKSNLQEILCGKVVIEDGGVTVEPEEDLEHNDIVPTIKGKKGFDSPKADIDSLLKEAKDLGDKLKEVVFGQDNAIKTFVNGYFQSRLFSMTGSTANRPKATFLFAGPPGVGKTFLAENIAKALGEKSGLGEMPFKRFDMSEYSDNEAGVEFAGADAVYKGAKEGNVTKFVSENPRCVLLFDEIEKAHISVIYLFLQILDGGTLRDNKTDKKVSFTDAIIIFTTNAGRQLYEDSEVGDLSILPRRVIVKALGDDVNPETREPFFPPAICSRFASGNIVMFNHISAHNLCDIAKKSIEKNAKAMTEGTGIDIEIDKRAYTALLLAEGGIIDARTLTRRAETFFYDEMYELLRMVASDKTEHSVAEIEKIRVGIDLENATEDIKELFGSKEKVKALAFAGEDAEKAITETNSSVEFLYIRNKDEAVEAIKKNEIAFVLIDMLCGSRKLISDILNISDLDSEARDFFRFLREDGKGMPVYLLNNRGYKYCKEETETFNSQGIRGTLDVYADADKFRNDINNIAEELYGQKSIEKLGRMHKAVSFETLQSVSVDGKCAEIKLFDFKLTVAVESEDAADIMRSLPDTKFKDIIGAESAVEELKYFVDYLKNPKKYLGTGVKAPRGILLHGSPGTGKTLLAKAMAGEAGVTFIAAEGNQFLKQYVGEGPQAVKKLFKVARKYAPSILFIDEIDAIAKERRGAGASGGGTEETLTRFLTEMDGFSTDPAKPVFVLAATNFEVEPGRDKSLDPALMRRFDRTILVDLPNKEDRKKFLKMKMDKNRAFQLSEKAIGNIALRSTGMSLAALESIMELSLRSAIRAGSTCVTDKIFEEAFETFNSGDVKKWDESQLERVARHEAGHALICYLSGEKPSYLTVVARGDHGGYMQHENQEGKAIYTKEELLSKIRTSLGGRAAEIVFYGEKDGISTGAGGDLISATRLAKNIVCYYGMDNNFGLASIGDSLNDALSEKVLAAVNKILEEQMAEAIRIITENRNKIETLVFVLIERDHLTGPEIEAVIETGSL